MLTAHCSSSTAIKRAQSTSIPRDHWIRSNRASTCRRRAAPLYSPSPFWRNCLGVREAAEGVGELAWIPFVWAQHRIQHNVKRYNGREAKHFQNHFDGQDLLVKLTQHLYVNVLIFFKKRNHIEYEKQQTKVVVINTSRHH